MTLLQAKSLTKTFAGMDRPVIEDVGFHVDAGEVFALVGPSGCGKTTTLRVVAGFERADAGEVSCGGCVLQNRDTFVAPERRGIGFVFQDYALFPHLSVVGNVMFGIKHVPRSRRRQAATEALWMVGLLDFEDRDPHELSGGQQQRVALARAVAAGSNVILMDEPFSNLDPELRHATRSEIRQLAHRAGRGLVLVTHDQEEALSTADRLAVMHEGRLVQTGEPRQVYNQPATAFVAQFLGRTNLLEVEGSGQFGTSPLGRVELNPATTGAATGSLRPEHLALRPWSDGDGEPAGTVTVREFKGHDMTYRVRLGPREYVVQTDDAAPFRVGDKVRLVPKGRVAVLGNRNASP